MTEFSKVTQNTHNYSEKKKEIFKIIPKIVITMPNSKANVV